ncbi:MAG: 50S ribosomal protein L17 [Prevotellaceae bacterium]|jgi:large subunit ribosomal protein L17|nr:50S ribosomal protein L17 [Prevotellaceae bacterium]
MRHNNKFNHLGRTASHRAALLSNMACSLIKHKRISTTTAKAKALRRYVEPIITKSKLDTTHSRRMVFSMLKDKTVVAELFRDVAAKIGSRPGGYTRILRTGFRQGDAAEMCIIELVDYNENMLKETTKKTVTRTRRSRKSAVAATEVNEVKPLPVDEQPSEDIPAAEYVTEEPSSTEEPASEE